MTTSSPTTDDESLEFATAAEFFGEDEIAATDGGEHQGEPYAKGILWYDQATPVFTCLSCHEHVAAHRFAGDGRREDYDEFRAEQYRRLFEDDPRCDVCAGRLPEQVDV